MSIIRTGSRALCVLATILGLGCACGPRDLEVVRDEGRLGSVRIFERDGADAAIVFLFSDAKAQAKREAKTDVKAEAQGFGPELEAAARQMLAEGALVVGVDLSSYLQALRESDDGCHYVVAEIEDLSHRLQRERGFASYRSPILAGIGAGGTLVYAALAQAPAATVAGAVSVDPTPALATNVPLCEGAPATADPDRALGFRYGPYGGSGPRAALPGFWLLSPRTAVPAEVAELAEQPPGAPPTGSPAKRLAALVDDALARVVPADAPLGDLPLVELPVEAAAAQMAVIYSGDGGWRDLDKDIAEVLAREGTPVVGVDSLRYFWSEKTPEIVAADLARILRHYSARFGAKRVLLVGYSFGADVLPFAMRRLPVELQRDVVQVSLLGLIPRAPFQVSVEGWLGEHDEGLPVLPELLALPPGLIQCVYGEEEDDTLCTAPELRDVERIRTPGGHHFDGDYEKLAREILDGAARRSEAAPRPGRS